MTKRKSYQLLDMLAELEDPCKDKGKRHPLKSILAIIVIGLMCGHNFSAGSPCPAIFQSPHKCGARRPRRTIRDSLICAKTLHSRV